jgi:hypothetical protein
MKAYRGRRVIAPLILSLDSRPRGVVNFTFRPLYLGERTPGTDCIGGYVGPRKELEVFEKRKKLLHLPGFESRVVQPIALSPYRIRHSGSRLPQR